ncbi:type II toxin-antitoxin system VapC family toxin [Chitinimonas arctica]|uniref:type II toxin-antitoxin system VapC family toxin n=1 Tax=Chitinimonas arctica TaxID=2594795 RepID=UPI001CC66385|nr:type II toxin-antitoxin system VapC family toxin [Chitinimonas arctica]
MTVLIDTHVLVWLLEGNRCLSPNALQLIDEAAARNTLRVAAITPWEIAMLVSKGRLALDRDVGEWIEQAMALPGIKLTQLDPAIAVASTRLPWNCHPDPADRMIVATARHLEALLITEDSLLLGYAEQGHFNAKRACK